MLERCQREVDLLEYLPEEPEHGSEIAASDRECSQIPDSRETYQPLIEKNTYYSFQTNDMFVGIDKGKDDEHDVVIK